MPDVILEPLIDLLISIRDIAVPPTQVLSNLMSTLPKKDGGVRTVAIVGTLYRLLMEVGNLSMNEFESKVAFVDDSAKSGASAVLAAEDRAFEAELAAMSGHVTLQMLWDIKKFFDSLGIEVVLQEAHPLHGCLPGPQKAQARQDGRGLD